MAPVQAQLPQQPLKTAQPQARSSMEILPLSTAQQQQGLQREQTVEGEPMRLRGGCPGKFCGLPILPCRCDICIIPIPCC